MSNSTVEIIGSREWRRRWAVEEKLRIVADPAEVADALAHSLLYDGNRRVHDAVGATAHITAEYLIRHLARHRRRRHAVIDW
jgi:hypothetical protein